MAHRSFVRPISFVPVRSLRLSCGGGGGGLHFADKDGWLVCFSTRLDLDIVGPLCMWLETASTTLAKHWTNTGSMLCLLECRKLQWCDWPRYCVWDWSRYLGSLLKLYLPGGQKHQIWQSCNIQKGRHYTHKIRRIVNNITVFCGE